MNSIKESVNSLVNICHSASKDAGWWTAEDGSNLIDNPLITPVKLALIGTEISEAIEGDRSNLMDDKLPHRPMTEVELADAAIRIFDLAGAKGYDLGGAIEEKMAFNLVRPDHKQESRVKTNGKKY